MLYDLAASLVVAGIFIFCLAEAAEESNWRGRAWRWLMGTRIAKWLDEQ